MSIIGQGHSLIFDLYISSKVPGPVVIKFHVEPVGNKGAKNHKNGPGHMTNMVTMPIYV